MSTQTILGIDNCIYLGVSLENNRSNSNLL